jgi:two-component system, NarL family, response regulator LiaR
MSSPQVAQSAVGQVMTLMIVDDHEVVRRGLRAFFETLDDFQIVGEAGEALGASAIARAKLPALALVDLLLPGENGVGACRRIKKASPDTRCLLLTSASHNLPVDDAISAGVYGFLFKDIAAAELAQAMRRIARGEVVIDPRALDARQQRSPHAFNQLSAREQEVLFLIAKGMGNKEIGEQLQIAEKTVKSHVGAILSKLDLTDRTQVAVWVWQHGLNQA